MSNEYTFTYVDGEGNEKVALRVRSQAPPYYFDGVLETDTPLYHADPTCNHESVKNKWSGIECRHCGGWFCF